MARSLTTRPRLRVDLELAARMLPSNRPLDRFVAVNPLRGFEDQPFGDALGVAAALFGVRGHLPESAYRALHRAGRVTTDELRLALARRCPALLVAPPVVVGDRAFSTEELLLSDLLGGPEAPTRARTARTLAELVDAAAGTDLAGTLDHHIATWCGVVRTGATPFSASGDGLWVTWRTLAPHDAGLRSVGGGEVARAAAALPAGSEDAATLLLDRLGVPVDRHRDYLLAHLGRLPGWASFLATSRVDDDLMDYVALRLAYEDAALRDHEGLAAARVALLAGEGAAPPIGTAPTPEARAAAVVVDLLDDGATALPLSGTVAQIAHRLARFPVADRPLVWQEALELGHRGRFLGALAAADGGRPAGRPRAQVVCCIDPRSEGLRRHLEEAPDVETVGFAGFFGLPVAVHTLDRDAPVQSCPIILDPRVTAVEVPGGDEAVAARHSVADEAGGAAGAAYHDAAGQPSAFSLAEVGGILAGGAAAGRTLVPGLVARARATVRRCTRPERPTSLSLPAADAAVAADILRAMGMVEGFARLVVLCGHASRHENNPYRAALNCGACAGNAGGPNARLAAGLLNDPAVRTALPAYGVTIPADTWFVAAEHETTSDRVTVLDRHLVPASHAGDLARLEADLHRAGAALAAERLPALPGTAPGGTQRGDASRSVRRRAVDWGQIVPEWGLAGNAALLIAPRTSSRGAMLDRRVFLHSYDAHLDPEGRVLEAIMTGPLVVAHWINSQYYFSVTDPQVLGAGSKTRHNVVAGSAVLDGPAGDLRLGLPVESVAARDRLMHEPLRLLVAVEAPLGRVEAALGRNPAVLRLVANGWISLIARGGPDEPWYERTSGGTWAREIGQDGLP